MGDKAAMFCASCGTVCVLEGNCPQCAKPLKKLGKVGAINDSKRATQNRINKVGLTLDLQGLKREAESYLPIASPVACVLSFTYCMLIDCI